MGNQIETTQRKNFAPTNGKDVLKAQGIVLTDEFAKMVGEVPINIIQIQAANNDARVYSILQGILDRYAEQEQTLFEQAFEMKEPLRVLVDRVERRYIEMALSANITIKQAARFLDVPPSTLSEKMKRLGIRE